MKLLNTFQMENDHQIPSLTFSLCSRNGKSCYNTNDKGGFSIRVTKNHSLENSLYISVSDKFPEHKPGENQADISVDISKVHDLENLKGKLKDKTGIIYYGIRDHGCDYKNEEDKNPKKVLVPASFCADGSEPNYSKAADINSVPNNYGVNESKNELCGGKGFGSNRRYVDPGIKVNPGDKLSFSLVPRKITIDYDNPEGKGINFDDNCYKAAENDRKETVYKKATVSEIHQGGEFFCDGKDGTKNKIQFLPLDKTKAKESKVLVGNGYTPYDNKVHFNKGYIQDNEPWVYGSLLDLRRAKIGLNELCDGTNCSLDERKKYSSYELNCYHQNICYTKKGIWNYGLGQAGERNCVSGIRRNVKAGSFTEDDKSWAEALVAKISDLGDASISEGKRNDMKGDAKGSVTPGSSVMLAIADYGHYGANRGGEPPKDLHGVGTNDFKMVGVRERVDGKDEYTILDVISGEHFQNEESKKIYFGIDLIIVGAMEAFVSISETMVQTLFSSGYGVTGSVGTVAKSAWQAMLSTVGLDDKTQSMIQSIKQKMSKDRGKIEAKLPNTPKQPDKKEDSKGSSDKTTSDRPKTLKQSDQQKNSDETIRGDPSAKAKNKQENGEECISADYFGPKPIAVSAHFSSDHDAFIPGDGEVIDPETGEINYGFHHNQVVKWEDTGLETNGDSLKVRVNGAWTSWSNNNKKESKKGSYTLQSLEQLKYATKFEGKQSDNSLPNFDLVCNDYKPSIQKFSSKPNASCTVNCKCINEDDSANTVSRGAPCWFTNGHGAYLLFQTGKDDPNENLKLMRDPQYPTVHLEGIEKISREGGTIKFTGGAGYIPLPPDYTEKGFRYIDYPFFNPIPGTKENPADRYIAESGSR
uniref:Uncharacterized protein n=1 Tax=Glossina morsitans morsitans TaxID=37546 RepID=A0A1B0G599_GLOMM